MDLDADAYRNEPAQKIKEAWETSMDTLRPLLRDIAATDRLIDRIVYQWYGLTDEEIAVVEGGRIVSETRCDALLKVRRTSPKYGRNPCLPTDY